MSTLPWKMKLFANVTVWLDYQSLLLKAKTKISFLLGFKTHFRISLGWVIIHSTTHQMNCIPNNGNKPLPWPPSGVSTPKELILKTPKACRIWSSWYFNSISSWITLTKLWMWFFMIGSWSRSILWSISLSIQFWSKGGVKCFCFSKSLRTPIRE